MKHATKPLSPIIFVVLFLPLFAKAQTNVKPAVPMPKLFEEGVVSTSLYERDMAISPDGNEMFYTVAMRPSSFQTIIHRVKTKDGQWSAPKVASFSGQFTDLEPAFSADGKKLFFCSNRPLTGMKSKDFDIWFMEKKDGVWGEPQNVGNTINSDKDEFYPSVAQNGNLYFTATRKGGIGREDIYLARWRDGQYADPEVLDTAINSSMYEFNAYISPDEQFILFSSFGRAGEKGGGDLYISLKDATGHWQPARNMVMLNSEKLDYCPFVSFDKKTMFFTSDRHDLSSSFPGKPVSFSQLQHFSSSALNGGGNIYFINFSDLLNAMQNQ
jgi:Tol biopolymer transport system component